MLKLFRHAVGGIIAALVFVIPSTNQAGDLIFNDDFPSITTAGCPGINPEALEREVFDLVNSARQKAGLRSYRLDSRLAESARLHSADMALYDYFSHADRNNERVRHRARAAGYIWNKIGENIARGQPSAQLVMDEWLASSGHRGNILDSGFCDIGIGVAAMPTTDCAIYWTQNFGRQPGTANCN